MSRLSSPRRASFSVFASVIPLLAFMALVTACGSQIAPTASTTGSGAIASDAAPSGAGSGGPSPDATGPATPSITDAAGGTDEACLAVIPRADVAAALNTTVDGVVAVGTDPAVSLTCTYAAGDGSLVVTTSASDVASGFQSSLDLAESYGQNPIMIDGLGEQAFYAIAADRWPEQVVFVTGPVLVRLVNQSPTTIGEVPFAALAATAAESIRSKIAP